MGLVAAALLFACTSHDVAIVSHKVLPDTELGEAIQVHVERRPEISVYTVGVPDSLLAVGARASCVGPDSTSVEVARSDGGCTLTVAASSPNPWACVLRLSGPETVRDGGPAQPFYSIPLAAFVGMTEVEQLAFRDQKARAMRLVPDDASSTLHAYSLSLVESPAVAWVDRSEGERLRIVFVDGSVAWLPRLGPD